MELPHVVNQSFRFVPLEASYCNTLLVAKPHGTWVSQEQWSCQSFFIYTQRK